MLLHSRLKVLPSARVEVSALRPARGRLQVDGREPQLDLSASMRAASQRRRLPKVSVVERAPAEAGLVRHVLRVDFEQRRARHTFNGRQLGLLAHQD